MPTKLCLGAVLSAFAGLALAAQAPNSVALSLKETTGIRRYGYPVGVRVPFPQGSLASSADTRLVLKGTEVSAQYTDEGKWPDGSVQWLAVNFNATIGPDESQTYQLEYGLDVKPGPRMVRKLNLLEFLLIRDGSLKARDNELTRCRESSIRSGSC
jgi:hypothetical protein